MLFNSKTLVQIIIMSFINVLDKDTVFELNSVHVVNAQYLEAPLKESTQLLEACNFWCLCILFPVSRCHNQLM